MKKVILLTKVFLKNSFNSTSDAKKKIGNLIVYIILGLYLFGIVGFASYDLIKELVNVGMEKVALILFLGLTLVITGFQSILVSMNVFYFSKENENILPLPLKPKEILLAKLFNMLVMEDILILLIGIPFMVIYMMLCDMGILFLIRALLIISIIPIISISIVSFIMLIITNMNKKMRNKDTMQIFNIVMVLAILFFTMQSVNIDTKYTTQDMISLLEKNDFIQSTLNNLPFFLNNIIEFFEGKMVITNLGIILLVLSFIIILFLNFSEKIYLKTLTKINTTTSTVNISKKTYNYKKKNIGIEYVKKEFKILFRNPIYLMQCILPIILLPCVMILAMTAEIGSLDIIKLRNTFSALEIIVDPFLVCTVLIGMQLLSIFVYIAITAFSRDGNNAVFTKYIPISFEKQITYKVMPNIILCSIWPIVIGIVIKYVIPSVDIIIIILSIIATLILNTIFSYIDIFIDLKRPKLVWDTEYAVVKNNMNMLIQSIFQSFGVVFLAISTMIINFITKDTIIYLVILNAILLILYMIVKLYIKKNQTKLMKNIC